MHKVAQHHEVGFPVLADAWDYGLKSSGLIQTAAALIHFGLLNDKGSGKNRKFQLTRDALRIIQDADPESEKRKEAIKRAALKPKIHTELWSKFGALSGISDFVLTNYLTLDRKDEGEAPFSSTAAEELVNEYKATIGYAGVTVADTIPPVGSDIESAPEAMAGGQMQQPQTGQTAPSGPPPMASAPTGEASLVLYDDRIRISADVDLEGAKALVAKLNKRIKLLEEEHEADEG